jgi:Putative peptidoglycan binding domain
MPTNRNRTIVPGNTPGAANVTGRTVVTPNQRPNVATSNGTRNNRVRIPSRTGNELSFAQAQAQCSRHHHDRNWWRNHHTRICFYGGGYWFWNAGWWFPAWGYSPFYNNYIYDGPIFGYGELSPGDVTAQVQEALAQQGYYYGPIDGVLGPETRDAILRFQADHGLATTAAIDEATLDTLGLT